MSSRILLAVPLLFGVGISRNCDAFYECYKHKFTENAQCFGFASCFQAKFTKDATVRCDGDRSCYQSQMDVSKSVKCRSAASCESAKIKTSDVVNCEGSHSCVKTEMSANEALLNGHYAAAMSTLKDTDLVVAHGYSSLLFGTVDSNKLNHMEVRVDGLNAGYGASVVCRADADCKLSCKGNGCDNLDFYCFDGAECTVTPKGCMEGKKLNSINIVKGAICPTVKYSKSEKEDQKLSKDLNRRYHKIEKDDNYIEFMGSLNEDMDLWQRREQEFTPVGGASKAGNERILVAASSRTGPAMFARFGHHFHSLVDTDAVIMILIVMCLLLAIFCIVAQCEFGMTLQCQCCGNEEADTVEYQKV